MFDEAVKNKLSAEFEGIIFDEPLKKHTTMGVGGPADGFLYVSEEQIAPAVKFCRENGIPFHVMGNGSNTVGRDGGFRGIILCVGRKMNSACVSDEVTVTAQAGAKLSAVAELAAKSGIGGFEFLAGIPGNLGGAIVMNAGAYGGEIKDLLVSVSWFENGEIRTEAAHKLGFGYRKSYFISNPGCIVTGAVLRGTPRSEEDIREQMSEYLKKRSASQPLEYPSSGSFFKRPEGYFAGKLVQDCGLKGFAVGGAAISEKHAGFVINKGGATGEDIQNLAEYVKKCVMERFGVELEPEVRFLGCDK
ncbi:MAG: UDP-N-acetylmuramate dehydrogenase [Clostridia bacterium]|nr:UDP-N-acetylmuramate dehydrogenase [Clostridia bacterium]